MSRLVDIKLSTILPQKQKKQELKSIEISVSCNKQKSANLEAKWRNEEWLIEYSYKVVWLIKSNNDKINYYQWMVFQECPEFAHDNANNKSINLTSFHKTCVS